MWKGDYCGTQVDWMKIAVGLARWTYQFVGLMERGGNSEEACGTGCGCGAEDAVSW
jgi:hypothetical protein